MEHKKSINTLPEGWIWTTIGEILILEYGKALPNKLRIRDGKYPVYGSNGKVGFHSDFLVDGPVIIMGRKGSVGAIHLENNKCWPIDTTYFIVKTRYLNQKFIYYLLKNLHLEKLDSSTTIPGINRNNVYELKIPLPPLDEQCRIVGRIEELFSELDHAEEALRKAQKQLVVYKQALLKSAFEGKLTKRWREENVEKFNWYFKSIGELGLVKGGKRLPKNSAYSETKTDHPYIRVTDLLNYSVSDKDIKYITIDIHRQIRSYTISTNDVYISIAGTVGLSGVIPISLNNANLTENAAKISINNSFITNKYLAYILSTPQLKTQIKEKTKATSQPKLSLYNIRSLLIPVPKLSEQQKIVQELELRFTHIENFEKTIEDGLIKAAMFKKIILEKAFDGKLVPQNNEDQPAAILLDLIQKEKVLYVSSQKLKQKEKPKLVKPMKTNKREIKEILEKSMEPVSSEVLWLESIYFENIEAFYAELKKIEHEIEVIISGKESSITLKR